MYAVHNAIKSDSKVSGKMTAAFCPMGPHMPGQYVQICSVGTWHSALRGKTLIKIVELGCLEKNKSNRSNACIDYCKWKATM